MKLHHTVKGQTRGIMGYFSSAFVKEMGNPPLGCNC